MRVSKLQLTDFRIYQLAEVVFDQPLAIIRGANHQGKTSLAQAIQLSLSVRSDGTDPRGAGANDKIRVGANKASIEMQIVGKSGVIDLTTSYGPGKSGRTQRITVPDSADRKIPDGFAGYLETNKERLGCVLDSEYFTSPKTDQKAILAALVLPTSYAFDPAMVTMAEKQMGRFEWNKPPVAVIDQVYDAAYKARTAAKAALGAIHIPQTPQQPENDTATVQSRLTELRAMAAKESRKKAPGTVQVGRLEQQLATMQQTLKSSDSELDRLHSELSEVNSLLLESAAIKKHERVAAGRKLLDDLEAKIEDTLREIQAQKDAQYIYEELLESPLCPTCTQAITKDFIDGKIAAHKALENEAVEQQISFLQEQRALGDIAGSESILSKNNAYAERKRGFQSAISAESTRVAELKVQLQGVEVQLVDAKAVEAEPVDTSVIDSLNADIAAWERALRPAVQYDAILQQIETSSKQWEDQKAKVNDLETLCAHFGKDGIKATLIADHVGAFTDSVNSVLKTWGYRAELSIEPYEFLVTSKNGTLPLKELSGSERLMFGVALQCAIAVHAKIKMVLIDKADTMINGERGRLFGCIKGMLDAKTLDQAIVLVSDDRAEAPKQDGVGFYRVADGSVVRL